MNQYFNLDSNEIENQILYDKIEVFIQQTENIVIPAIIFEYNSNENIDFDRNDLIEFYEQFGDIEDFQSKGKISIVLFTTFFAVNSCKEFLENKNNFKDNINVDFKVRWFDYQNDFEYLSEERKEKYKNIMMKNILELKKKSLIYFKDQNNNFHNNINQNNSINNSNIILNNNIQSNIINMNQNPFIIPQENLMNMNMEFNMINQNNLNFQLQKIYLNNLINTGMELYNNKNQIINNNNNKNYINNINKSPSNNQKKK
jgi:hypothetical protein